MTSGKHKLLLLCFFIALLSGACGKAAEAPTVTPSQTEAVAKLPTQAPTSSPIPVLTLTPTVTPVPINTPIPTPTLVPTATATPAPTNTPTPTPTSTPSPTPTNTPTPTLTNTPTPTPTNTPTPTPTQAPVIPEGFPNLVYREKTILEETVLTSEEEANRYLFQMAMDGYYKFGLLVEDITMLHTPEEYLEMFPEILSLEAESLTKYRNGYYLRFSDMKTTQTDLATRYALRTGDTSFLSDNELLAYRQLFIIADELQLKELSDIDAVMAVHDYLVRNTVYDEVTSASGSGGPSHYAEGTLLNGLAVCSGYASTFQLFMMLTGIPCEYVWNDVHAWNLVQVEEEWYHIDVTWDDPVKSHPELLLYTHFMMTDEEISKLEDHSSWICECGGSHNCDDSSYRLYPYTEVICTTENEAYALIQKQADQSIITLVYPANSSLTEDSLLQLTYQSLELSGNIAYFPEESLGDNHHLLHIIIK